MKKYLFSIMLLAGMSAFLSTGHASPVEGTGGDDDLWVVCYSDEGCYWIDDEEDCVAGYVDDKYFEDC